MADVPTYGGEKMRRTGGGNPPQTKRTNRSEEVITMKHMKKPLSILLTICMIVGLIP